MTMWGEATIHVHPTDAEKLGISKGDLVRISSANGSVEMRARVHDDVQAGQVFLPIHHQDQPVNRLVPFQANGDGRRPAIKSLAVNLERIGGPAPTIQRLADYQKRGVDLWWQRVYGYAAESHVRFNHAPHIRAGVECTTCHGDVAHQSVAQRNVDLHMGFCVNCHRQKQAPNDCLTCHF